MSYTIYNPCEDEVVAPSCDPCLDDIEHGRVRGVSYVHKSYYPTIMEDPTNAAAWAAGIASKLIFVIPETLGSFDGGAPVETTGYGDAQTKIVGYNFVLNHKDPNYKANCAFYNSIKGSANWHLAFRSEKLTRITSNPVTIIPKSPIAEDLNSEVVWDVENKWSQGDQPCPFDTPADVFVCASL